MFFASKKDPHMDWLHAPVVSSTTEFRFKKYWGYQKYRHLFEHQKTKKNPVLCDKRRKLTQASKAKKLIYKDRK